MKKVLIFMLFSLCFPVARGQDANVQTLSEGACWYEQGDLLKVASFNDKTSIVLGRDEIESQVEKLLGARAIKAVTPELTLHCGGYGASLVVRTEYKGRPACVWLKFNKGKLEMRSLGGLEETKSHLCDGYSWGELIVGLTSVDQRKVLESESFQSMILSVSPVSEMTMKVVLKPGFEGQELMVMAELKRQMRLRYVELNSYQHPIGEAASLK